MLLPPHWTTCLLLCFLDSAFFPGALMDARAVGQRPTPPTVHQTPSTLTYLITSLPQFSHSLLNHLCFPPLLMDFYLIIYIYSNTPIFIYLRDKPVTLFSCVYLARDRHIHFTIFLCIKTPQHLFTISMSILVSPLLLHLQLPNFVKIKPAGHRPWPPFYTHFSGCLNSLVALNINEGHSKCTSPEQTPPWSPDLDILLPLGYIISISKF